MKKFFVVLPIVLLSSCTWWGSGDESFDALYQKNIHAQIQSVQNIGKTLGIMRKEERDGTLKASVQVPVLLSGALSLDYNAKLYERDGYITAKNVQFDYESLVSSGSVGLGELSLISKLGDTFFRFQDFQDGGVLPEDVRKVFDTYNNTWLSWTREDARKSLSGTLTPEEEMTLTVTENISKITLENIEQYLTKNPLWKPTTDLGMSGALHLWSIDLNRSGVVSLVDALMNDLTGVPMTDEERTNMTTNLDSLVFSGTVGYNPVDPSESELSLAISGTGGVAIGTVRISSKADTKSIVLTSAQDNTTIAWNYDKAPDRYSSTILLSQDGVEMARVSGYIALDGENMKELSLEATTQGVTVTFKHTRKDASHFEGRLTLPVGAVSWTGTNEGEKLTGLSLKGAIPSGSIDMELTQSDKKLTGPLVIRMDGQEFLRAMVGLQLEKDVFGLTFDMPTGEGSGSMNTHLGIELVSRVREWSNPIDTPSSPRSLDQFFRDLDAIAPVDPFVEEVPLDTDMSGIIDVPSVTETLPLSNQ